LAISVNWPTGVITVPQADLTFVSAGLYELDLNTFRLALKDLEDSEEGAVWPDTHRHNTAATLSGVTYARQVEILAPYTVTFEQKAQPYTVSCVGANHNLADVKNVNTVSLIVGNSAGLIVGGGEGSAPSVAQIWAREVEGGFSAEEVLRLVAAALLGKASGASGTEIAFRDLADTKDRIVATVDQYGNRSDVELDAD
jgi:hypothetical protein